jgi:dethiobiotin synthetase
MKQLIFVAGTGTDIGKTYVSAGLIRAAKARGQKVVALKPIVSGAPDIDDPAFADTDTAKFLEALQQPLDAAYANAISPWRFRAPLSPDMAAHLEGRSVQFDALLDWTRAHVRGAPQGAFVLIEGAGGLMSPLTPHNTNLDLLAALGAPVLLVSGNYLGSISHTLTAVEALKARNAALAALVVNESSGDNPPLDATIETLLRFLPDVRIVVLQRQANPDSILDVL